MNISFYLNTQLKTRHGDHPVYMYITYDGKRIRKPVAKVHTSPKFWDEEKQRIKRPAKADPLDETKSFNKRLEFIEAQVRLIDQEAFDRRITLTETGQFYGSLSDSWKNEFRAFLKEMNYEVIPMPAFADVTQSTVQENYKRVKLEAQSILIEDTIPEQGQQSSTISFEINVFLAKIPRKTIIFEFKYVKGTGHE